MSCHKLLNVLIVIVFLGSLLSVAPEAQAVVNECASMPPNPDKILTSLITQGRIDPTASEEDQEAALDAYIRQKLGCTQSKSINPLAHKLIEANEIALNQYTGLVNGRKLGIEPAEVPAAGYEFKPLEGVGSLLLILVDFSAEEYTWTTADDVVRTEAGPLHNQIPEPDNDFDLWVRDFSVEHFQNMLFTPGGWKIPEDNPHYAGEHRGSMVDYFIEQSYGRYTVEGDTYGWFTVDKPEAYYGDDASTGDDMRPGTPRDMLADAVDVINAEEAIDWLAYDVQDLYDLDADGIIDEPDCIIDHPLFVHAGIDQSGGGGLQGDDAIWAHSASTEVWVTPEKNPGASCPAEWEGTMLYNYTIMPEDGGVGVFAHEYAHDLGLPDEYDTAGSGYGASTGFWTLQDAGSWIGLPAQTQPSGMSIWARYVLGWVDPEDNLAVLNLSDLGKDPLALRLTQTELWGGEGEINAVKVNLPDKYYYINDPYSGDFEWYGDKADLIDTTLRRTVDLTTATTAQLSFATWYEIEQDWDYGFVQVSTDGGTTWISLPIEGTTATPVPDAHPSIVPNMPGFTGSSGGWLLKTFDLADYVGQTIELQFRYMTDWGTTLAGFFVDDIGVTADGAPVFFDDVELLDPAWVVGGWLREEGSGYKPHYYIMEWRNLNPLEIDYDGTTIVNFDAGLNNVYNFDPFGPTPTQPAYYPYTPGLLLFYRDFTYTDNWTGIHPGAGFMLVVDAHKRPLIRPPYKENYGGLAWDARVQSYDATFGLDPAADIELTRYTNTQTYYALPPMPNFNDAHSYWSEKAFTSSVITPNYGLVFRILGQADDKSAISIAFGNLNALDEELYMSIMSDYFSIFEKLFMPAIMR